MACSPTLISARCAMQIRYRLFRVVGWGRWAAVIGAVFG